MLGSMDKKDFNPEVNYEAFYHSHKFQPFPIPFDCHEVLPRAAWTLDAANEMEAKSYLDLCCLDGFVPLTLAKHCATLHKIWGVDLSEPGINRAKELALTLNDKRDIVFIQDSVENFFAGLSPKIKFDIITMFEAVEHFKNTPVVIELAKEHLKPDGRIMISTPDAEGVYGIGNDDACHLRYYSHKAAAEWGDLTHEWEGREILSLPDEITALGGQIVDNDVYNELIHLSATFH